MRSRLCFIGFLLALPLLLSACATVRTDAPLSDYRKTIRKLQQKIAVNPKDAESLRDLGVIYFQTRQYPAAHETLRKASEVNDGDAKTQFYTGMTYEAEFDKKAALATYINYTDFSPLSTYRKLMEGRYQAITRELIKDQFRVLIAQEAALGSRETPKNNLAVFPLVYQGTQEKFSSLGLGLSEMMLVDLGQVAAFKLVERIRIEELMKELQFSKSQAVDPSSAPRMGRLLAAGRIVSGTYDISNDNVIRLDVAALDVSSSAAPKPVTESDNLDNMFRMQKEIVFKIVKDLGINLTRDERERIQRIPTKSLQAFIAYSIGLEKEGEGNYDAATVYFKQAAAIDPNFAPAKAKVEATESLSLAGGSKEQALAAAQKVDPAPSPDAGDRGGNLMTDRIMKLQQGIGSGLIPGQDSRKPAEEAIISGAAVGELPLPPQPPK